MIEAHLSDCPRCAAELAQHREVAALLANAGSDASVELWDRIAARLDPPGEPPPAATVLDAALAGALPRQRRRAAPPGPVVGRRRHRGHGRRRHRPAGAPGGSSRQPGRPPRRDRPPPRPPCAIPQARTGGCWHRHVAAQGSPPADIVVLPSGAGLRDQQPPPTALASDETYQLWGVEQGRTISLGLLGNHPADVAFTEGHGTPITAYAVTAERAPVASSPSTHAPVAESAPVRT